MKIQLPQINILKYIIYNSPMKINDKGYVFLDEYFSRKVQEKTSTDFVHYEALIIEVLSIRMYMKKCWLITIRHWLTVLVLLSRNSITTCCIIFQIFKRLIFIFEQSLTMWNATRSVNKQSLIYYYLIDDHYCLRLHPYAILESQSFWRAFCTSSPSPNMILNWWI